jgi:hypothetical protein
MEKKNFIPGSTVMVKLTGIDWDWTSRDDDEFGNKPNLPDDLIVSVEVDEGDDENQILDQAVDNATDQFGFCIFGVGGSEIIGDNVVDVLVKVNVTEMGQLIPKTSRRLWNKSFLKR